MADIYLSAETKLGLQQASSVLEKYQSKDVISIFLVIPERNIIITMKDGSSYQLEADPNVISHDEFIKTFLRNLADEFEQGAFGP